MTTSRDDALGITEQFIKLAREQFTQVGEVGFVGDSAAYWIARLGVVRDAVVRDAHALALVRRWHEEDEGASLETIVERDEACHKRHGRAAYNEQFVEMVKAIIAATRQ